jgi:hypothetical protein
VASGAEGWGPGGLSCPLVRAGAAWSRRARVGWRSTGAPVWVKWSTC